MLPERIAGGEGEEGGSKRSRISGDYICATPLSLSLFSHLFDFFYPHHTWTTLKHQLGSYHDDIIVIHTKIQQVVLSQESPT